MSAELPVPFVVGCGRSGTTLLRSFLDAHPDLAVPGESHFLATMIRVRRRYERGGGFDRDAFLSDLRGHDRFRRWHLEHDTVQRAFAAHPPADLADAVRLLYRSYAQDHGASRWGDKTPDYVVRMPGIATLLPEARFVHVIRDGRDVAASLLAQEWGPSSPRAAAHHWSRRVRGGRQAGQALGDRYREIRYEDLVGEPEAVLRGLCGFLALDFDERMLDRTSSAARAMTQAAAPMSHTTLTAPTRRRSDRWEALPATARRTIEHTAGRELRLFGYGGDGGRHRDRVLASGLAVGAAVTAAPRRARALGRFLR